MPQFVSGDFQQKTIFRHYYKFFEKLGNFQALPIMILPNTLSGFLHDSVQLTETTALLLATLSSAYISLYVDLYLQVSLYRQIQVCMHCLFSHYIIPSRCCLGVYSYAIQAIAYSIVLQCVSLGWKVAVSKPWLVFHMGQVVQFGVGRYIGCTCIYMYAEKKQPALS